MNLLNQTLLDQFRVDAFIQAGGMGSVYRVWDLKRNAALAMKVLHADLAEDPLILSRFQREASVLQTLAHPHIVPFYGLLQGPGFSFLLERFIDGPSLKEVLSARRGAALPLNEALTYLKALAAALGYAHNSNIVHCDVKPANVLLDQGGGIFLTDFGIARFADTTATTLRSIGTPAYMAPEQITAQPVSPATDVYALGVLLFELLTGQKPFRGSESIFETLPNAGQTTSERIRYAHLFLSPPDPLSLNPSLPPQLAQVVLTALAKDPAARFRTTQALFTAACHASGTAPESLPERATLSTEVLAAHASGAATTPPEISPPYAPAVSSWPPAAPPSGQTATQPPDYSPPYPQPPYPPQAYYPYPPPAKKGLPAIAWVLIALGALALVILAAVALGKPQTQPTAAPITPQINTDTPQPPLSITATPSITASPTSFTIQPVTDTPVYIQPTPVFPIAYLRRVGSDWIPVNAQADWNSQVITSLADGTQVWLTGLQTYDGNFAWAEIYYESGGSYLPGWVDLDYLPGIPNLVITETPTPAASANYLLAYVSGQDGAWQIYLNDYHGNAWALPNQPANSGVPAWSPDHQWLAFRSNASGSWQVYKIRSDGSELTQLTYSGQNYEPNWSPDGAQLAFVSDRDGNKELYLMNADGSSQTRLTNNDVVDDDPSFSPYGNALVFESKRNDHMDVYWMDLNDPANQIPVTAGGSYNGTPAWSPNGSYILYEHGDGSETHLWMIETQGWTSTQFTFSGTKNHRPAWSADGNYVAYTSDESGGWQVHVVNFYDGSAQPVSSGLGYDPAPWW